MCIQQLLKRYVWEVSMDKYTGWKKKQVEEISSFAFNSKYQKLSRFTYLPYKHMYQYADKFSEQASGAPRDFSHK